MRLAVTIPGDPVPTARARLARRGGWMYTPKRTRDYQKVVADYIQRATLQRGRLGLFRVTATFYRGTRRRVDLDNLLKSVLDGTSKAGIWADDSQVREIEARVFLGQTDPRLELVLEEIDEGG